MVVYLDDPVTARYFEEEARPQEVADRGLGRGYVRTTSGVHHPEYAIESPRLGAELDHRQVVPPVRVVQLSKVWAVSPNVI